MSQIEDIGDAGNAVTESADLDMSPGSIMDQQFDDLCEQYYHSWFRFHPEDDQLRSYEHDDIGALIALNQKMQSALEELNRSQLDTRRQIDYRLISGAISIELHSGKCCLSVTYSSW